MLDKYARRLSRLRRDIKLLINDMRYIKNYAVIKDSDTLEERVYKLYLLTGSVVDVAKTINKSGYRVDTDSWIGKRKYIPKDITKILDRAPSDLGEVIKRSRHL